MVAYIARSIAALQSFSSTREVPFLTVTDRGPGFATIGTDH